RTRPRQVREPREGNGWRPSMRASGQCGTEVCIDLRIIGERVQGARAIALTLVDDERTRIERHGIIYRPLHTRRDVPSMRERPNVSRNPGCKRYTPPPRGEARAD